MGCEFHRSAEGARRSARNLHTLSLHPYFVPHFEADFSDAGALDFSESAEPSTRDGVRTHPYSLNAAAAGKSPGTILSNFGSAVRLHSEGRATGTCVKTHASRRQEWIPACAGMTSLELKALSNTVIPAKAGIHEFSHGLNRPARRPIQEEA
jgi:hypothetical protein